MSYDDIDSPDYNDTNVGSGFVESAEERRERKEAERAAKQPKSTETRWPNVQAFILSGEDVTLSTTWGLIVTCEELSTAGATIEQSLNSLEQKLAERKDGK